MIGNVTLEEAKQVAYQKGVSSLIKQLMLKKDCSVQELAKYLGIKPQSLSTKLYRDRFTCLEFQIILELLEFEIAIVDKEGKRHY